MHFESYLIFQLRKEFTLGSLFDILFREKKQAMIRRNLVKI